MTTNERLRQIMDAEGLSYKKVAEILGVSVATVTAWLRPATNKAHRIMPANLLKLLELHITLNK